MSLDLNQMSRKDLLQLRKDVEKALKDAEQRERTEALKAAEQAASPSMKSFPTRQKVPHGNQKQARNTVILKIRTKRGQAVAVNRIGSIRHSAMVSIYPIWKFDTEGAIK